MGKRLAVKPYKFKPHHEIIDEPHIIHMILTLMSHACSIYKPPKHTGLDILFQDKYLLIVNKPANLLSVPGNTPEKKDCMVSRCQTAFCEP